MKKTIFASILFILLVVSCKEEGRLDHIDDSDPAPAPVTEVTVKSIPGGAVLKYTLPADKNLLYVKAEFETIPGEVREVKSSLYKDSIVIAGFGASGTYPVKLYSVGRNEKASEPVQMDINTLAPPIELTFPTLRLSTTFGGVKVSYENKARGDLAMVLMVDTIGGVWLPLQTFYTNNDAGSFSVRGMDTVDMKFGLYLRDRWSNKSDTLVSNVKPMFEEFITKDTWSKFTLAGDTDIPAENREDLYGLKGLWDGVTSAPYSSIFASQHDQPFPMTFTIKLGKTATLSRIVVHHRYNLEYASANPKEFELYGSNADNPGADLFGGDWQLLGKFRSKDAPSPIQPSDREEANVKGLSFDLEAIPGPVNDLWVPVKYIRFRTIETYKGLADKGQLIIGEISLYGKVIK